MSDPLWTDSHIYDAMRKIGGTYWRVSMDDSTAFDRMKKQVRTEAHQPPTQENIMITMSNTVRDALRLMLHNYIDRIGPTASARVVREWFDNLPPKNQEDISYAAPPGVNRYRELEREVDAIQFNEANAQAAADWLGDAAELLTSSQDNRMMALRTSDTVYLVTQGEWIMRYDDGFIAVLSASVFRRFFTPTTVASDSKPKPELTDFYREVPVLSGDDRIDIRRAATSDYDIVRQRAKLQSLLGFRAEPQIEEYRLLRAACDLLELLLASAPALPGSEIATLGYGTEQQYRDARNELIKAMNMRHDIQIDDAYLFMVTATRLKWLQGEHDDKSNS